MFRKIMLLLAVLAVSAGLGGTASFGQTEAESTVSVQLFVGGPRMAFFELFHALEAGDLILLQNGGLASGAVQEQQFTIGSRTLARDQILLIAWPAAGTTQEANPVAQVYLKDGSQVQGALQASSITLVLPTSESAALSVDQLRGIIFKVERPEMPAPPEQPGANPPSEAQVRQAQSSLFPLFSGLQGSALFQAIIQGLQKFDLLVFPDGEVLSGTIENQTFTLVSTIFGSHPLAVADLAQITFDDPDVVVLRIGDRVSGIVTPDGDGKVRATLATGSAVRLAKEELGGISFKAPAGPLGGGGRPRFQPGPGR
ncbi:MAG: hypothetical protein QHH25_00255 [Candidatus Acetothermia bacterium]|nr:hypothetical protein [Candidatus Acetothermia bacterium]